MNSSTEPYTSPWANEMHKLGWEFMPTGPNEWSWLKFMHDHPIARQCDKTWAEDVALVDAEMEAKYAGTRSF